MNNTKSTTTEMTKNIYEPKTHIVKKTKITKINIEQQKIKDSINQYHLTMGIEKLLSNIAKILRQSTEFSRSIDATRQMIDVRIKNLSVKINQLSTEISQNSKIATQNHDNLQFDKENLEYLKEDLEIALKIISRINKKNIISFTYLHNMFKINDIYQLLKSKRPVTSKVFYRVYKLTKNSFYRPAVFVCMNLICSEKLNKLEKLLPKLSSPNSLDEQAWIEAKKIITNLELIKRDYYPYVILEDRSCLQKYQKAQKKLYREMSTGLHKLEKKLSQIKLSDISTLNLDEINKDYKHLAKLLDLCRQFKISGDLFSEKTYANYKNTLKDLKDKIVKLKTKVTGNDVIKTQQPLKIGSLGPQQVLINDLKQAVSEHDEIRRSVNIKKSELAIKKACDELTKKNDHRKINYIKIQRKIVLSENFAKYYKTIEQDIELKLDYLPPLKLPLSHISDALDKYKNISDIVKYLEDHDSEIKTDNNDGNTPKALVEKLKNSINKTISNKFSFIRVGYLKSITETNTNNNVDEIFHHLHQLHQLKDLINRQPDGIITDVTKKSVEYYYLLVENHIYKEIEKQQKSLMNDVNVMIKSPVDSWDKNPNENIVTRLRLLKFKYDHVINDLSSLKKISPKINQLRTEMKIKSSKLKQAITTVENNLINYFNNKCDEIVKKQEIMKNNPSQKNTNDFQEHQYKMVEFLKYMAKHGEQRQKNKIVNQLTERGYSEETIFFTDKGELKRIYQDPELAQFTYELQIMQLERNSWDVTYQIQRYFIRRKIRETLNQPESMERINGLISIYKVAHSDCFNPHLFAICGAKDTKRISKNIAIDLLVDQIKDNTILLRDTVAKIYSLSKKYPDCFSAYQNILVQLVEISKNSDNKLSYPNICQVISEYDGQDDNRSLVTITKPQKFNIKNVTSFSVFSGSKKKNSGQRQIHDKLKNDFEVNTDKNMISFLSR